MALLAKGSPLVAGGAIFEETMKEIPTQKVRVLRGFYVKGEPQEVGKVITIPLPLAQEMRSIKKVEYIVEEKAPSTEDKQEQWKKEKAATKGGAKDVG